MKYDLIICGGGTSGCAAAYIASKLGLKTLLIEKNIHLGGSISSALVIPSMKTNTKNVNCEFYNDLITAMKKYNATITYSDDNDGWFNPELIKLALDDMLQLVSCDVLFDSIVKSVSVDKNIVTSVEIESKTLSLHIESLYFIDATGDGNFSNILKNKILENPESRQPMSMRFHISGINMEQFGDWLLKIDSDRTVTTVCKINGQTHLSTACTWDLNKNWALWPIFEEGISEGIISKEDASYFQLFTIPAMPNTVSLNCPRIILDKQANPLSIKDFSTATIKARQQIWRLYKFLKLKFVGFEHSYISNIADMVGIRESRRIQGKKIYTRADLESGTYYTEPILHGDYPIDIHSYKKDGSTLEKSHIDYELPIEPLMLSDYNNVFVIGRCLSATFEAQAALRVQKSCFSMGEGVAKFIANKVLS